MDRNLRTMPMEQGIAPELAVLGDKLKAMESELRALRASRATRPASLLGRTALGRIARAGIVASLLLLTLGHSALASVPDAGGVIHGCYAPHDDGSLRVIDTGTGAQCHRSEIALTWSQRGPQGIAGPQGPVGPTGATGPQGPIGLTGAAGPQGPIGLTGTTGLQGPQGVAGPKGDPGPAGSSSPYVCFHCSASQITADLAALAPQQPNYQALYYPYSDLTNANLSLDDLTNANLAGATLTSANLQGAILASADMNAAFLPGANLSSAFMEYASLSGAWLVGDDFSNAGLRGVNMARANLSQTTLLGANLPGANLTNANLTGANLSNANLAGAVVTGVTYHNTTCPDGQNSDNLGGTCAGQGGGL